MPIWLEILLNVVGYAGFIAIAIYHKSSGEEPDQDVPGASRVNSTSAAGPPRAPSCRP